MSPITRRATTNVFILIWAGIISILNGDLADFFDQVRRNDGDSEPDHYAFMNS